MYTKATMNEKVLQTLEYYKITAVLSEKCQTPLGREEADALKPMDDLFDIEKAQKETEDALTRLYKYGNVSCSGARDIRESLLRLKIEANLGMVELLNISMLLRTALRVKAYGDKKEDDETEESR